MELNNGEHAERMDHISKNPRKKRRTLTLADKKKIIEDREKYNQSFEELAEIYGVDRSTVSKIVKAKYTYLHAFEKLSQGESSSGSNGIYVSSQDMVKIDLDSYEPIEKMLAAWLENARKNKLLISKKVLLEKANEFFYLLKQDGCRLPLRPLLNGWLNIFIDKFGVILNEFAIIEEGSLRFDYLFFNCFLRVGLILGN